MNTKTNEQILFEAYLASIGYDYCEGKIYLKQGWVAKWLRELYYIAEIEIKQTELIDAIVVKGYGYPKTVTTIVEQMKSIFQKDVQLVFESDEPSRNNSYRYYA